jgi:hypothetical protein
VELANELYFVAFAETVKCATLVEGEKIKMTKLAKNCFFALYVMLFEVGLKLIKNYRV